MKRVEFKKEPRNDEARGYQLGPQNGYCFICGLALPAGVSFEPLWLFADMNIFL